MSNAPHWHNVTQQIETVDVDALIQPDNATRQHSNIQIDKLARSIERFGWAGPVLTDDGLKVVDGWAQICAARQLGLPTVPIIRLSHLSDAEARALRLAINKLPELTTWNSEHLRLEFEAVISMDADLDIQLTGFEMGELDLILDEPGEVAEESDPFAHARETVHAHIGDLFALGDHLLLCGDATSPQTYAQLLGDERIHLTFSDPPYNVPIQGHVSGKGKHQHMEFPMASGEMSPEQFRRFLCEVFAPITPHAHPGSLHYFCMDWRHIADLIETGTASLGPLQNICVWVKSNGGMGTLYRSQHEMIAVFKSGNTSHTNNVQLGRFGRNRTNVWHYPGVTSFGPDRDEALAMHPTVKPVNLVKDAILDASNRADLVVDPFLGSGTTLIACELTCRRCRAIELDPRYVEVAIRRWQAHTGESAIHVKSKLTFDELAEHRAQEVDHVE